MGHLARFVDDARARVRRGCYAPLSPVSPNGSLLAAVTEGSGIVAELKPRSPTRGRLLHEDPLEVLQEYKDGGACAFSVLADADHFDGSPELVRQANALGLPVLFKDFVVTGEQVACAAACGASAVLVIERCFASAAEREALVDAAHGAGLEVLLEVHGVQEWERALHSNADLFGVNARNLDTLELDVPGSLEVVQAIAAAGRPVMALSGVRRRADVLRARAAGAAGVLVGTSLLQAPSRALAVRGLWRPLAKVCGLTTLDGVGAAAAAGADLAGFVVGAPRSPRAISAPAAAPLVREARRLGLVPVLVTPERDLSLVESWCKALEPAFVQLHGPAPTEWVERMKAAGMPVLAATAPEDDVPRGVAGVVVDTPPQEGEAEGGTGRTHDWLATARLVAAHESLLTLVAGGLAGDNVAAALRATGATGADASSRLESSPGVKDPAAVAAFVAAAHGA